MASTSWTRGATFVLFGVAGLFVIGGFTGLCFTYRSVARERIVTPADASLPERPVRGPFTLKAQADTIRKHTLAATGGQTFAEMPREIQKKNPDGTLAVDAKNAPVMEKNAVRDMWVTATTLTSALYMALLAYAFFAGLMLVGGALLSVGMLLGARKG
jgi:hypothetical protein